MKYENFQDALSIIQNFWGDEFGGDTDYPFLLGGWYSKYNCGMNESIIDYTVPTKKGYARFRACLTEKMFPKGLKGKVLKESLIPILCGAKILNKDYKFLPTVSEKLWGDKKNLSLHFQKWRSNPNVFSGVYDYLLKHRRMVFKEFCGNTDFFKKDFFQEFYKEYPNKNILPPPSLLEWEVYSKAREISPYLSGSFQNSLSKYIKYLEQEKVLSESHTIDVEPDFLPAVESANRYKSTTGTRCYTFFLESSVLDDSLAFISNNYLNIANYYKKQYPTYRVPISLRNPPETNNPWWGYQLANESFDSIWNSYKLADEEETISSFRDELNILKRKLLNVEDDSLIMEEVSREEAKEVCEECSYSHHYYENYFKASVVQQVKRRKIELEEERIRPPDPIELASAELLNSALASIASFFPIQPD